MVRSPSGTWWTIPRHRKKASSESPVSDQKCCGKHEWPVLSGSQQPPNGWVRPSSLFVAWFRHFVMPVGDWMLICPVGFTSTPPQPTYAVLPRSNDNEINPDVLGYIFEKYINQKQMGAYYTKEDITEYISKNTVIPFLFDAAKGKVQSGFRQSGRADCLGSPARRSRPLHLRGRQARH
ncbi:MAG: hypothetical protein Q8P60_15270 [Pseudorhodobacter sp.]|nr:hypothetical protein [Pseudorhodobacter sp.]